MIFIMFISVVDLRGQMPYEQEQVEWQEIDGSFEQMVALRGISVLEIQPGNSYKLEKGTLAQAWGIEEKQINLTQMPMTQFIADVNAINGKYDIVYVGSGTRSVKSIKNINYVEEYRKHIAPNKDGSEVHKYKNEKGSFQEEYSGIDITTRKAKEIQELINSGQMVVFDNEIFERSVEKSVWLSDVKWESQTCGWGTIQKDQSIDQNPMTLLDADENEIVYQKGIGTHANSTIIYDLEQGKYSKFEAFVGVDREVKNKGSVIFHVSFGKDTEDGIKYDLGETTGILRGDTPQHQMSIDIPSDAIKLRLHVNIVENDGADHANWANAKLHLSEKTTRQLEPETKIYEMFHSIQPKDNYMRLSGVTAHNVNTKFKEVIGRYKSVGIKKRPYIQTEAIQTQTQLSIILQGYNYHNLAGNMEARVYLDVNGDGKFKEEEKVNKVTQSNLANNTQVALNIAVPDDFVGQLAWKVEVIDKEHADICNYQIGTFKYKGSTPQTIRILHIIPDEGNTFSIKNDLNDLFEQIKDAYIMNVTELTISEFQAQYDDKASYLNGSYDMVILGFKDMYDDIKNDRALVDVKDFIESGQSVMFTHDTMSFPHNGVGWSYELTQNFRDLLGQFKYNKDTNLNRYKYTNYALAGFGGGNTTTRVKKINTGQINEYPFELGDISVSPTHYQYYKLDLEDEDIVVWYTLNRNGYNWYDAVNGYYTYSKGNMTYCGTGHSNVSSGASLEERQLFVNTIVKAAKSSNHPPQVKILQLAEGQLMPLKESIKFGLIANDIDFFDETVRYEVYAYGDKVSKDKALPIATYTNQKVGQEIKDVTITPDQAEKLADQGQDLTIWIKAFDEKNAMGETSITVKRLDAPLQLTHEMDKEGYLVGDTGELTIQLESKVDQQVSDTIELETLDLTTLFNKRTEPIYKVSKKNINFNKPDEIFENVVKEIKFVEALNNQVVSKLVYNVKNTVQVADKHTEYKDTVQSDITVVKSKLAVHVQDNVNRPIGGATVKIAGKSYTTNNAGLVYLEGELSTGTYTVEVELPEGYHADAGQLTKKVSFEYSEKETSAYEKELKFELIGSPITNVQLTLIDTTAHTEASQVTVQELTTEIEAILRFNNLVEVSYQYIPIVAANGTDIVHDSQYTYSFIEAKQGEDTVPGFKISGNALIYEGVEDLPKGQYEVRFNVNLPSERTEVKQDIHVKEVSIKATDQVEDIVYTYKPIPTKVTIYFDGVAPIIIPDYNSKGLIELVHAIAKVDGTGSSVKEVKWAKGEMTLDECRESTNMTVLDLVDEIEDISLYNDNKVIWKEPGLVAKPSPYIRWITFPITENGVYTIYAKDNAGNDAVVTIIIHNIYKGTLPDIT